MLDSNFKDQLIHSPEGDKKNNNYAMLGDPSDLDRFSVQPIPAAFIITRPTKQFTFKSTMKENSPNNYKSKASNGNDEFRDAGNGKKRKQEGFKDFKPSPVAPPPIIKPLANLLANAPVVQNAQQHQGNAGQQQGTVNWMQEQIAPVMLPTKPVKSSRFETGRNTSFFFSFFFFRSCAFKNWLAAKF